MRKITLSFLLAIHNVKTNFFHTLLSVLGIVIGVGALVSILSLIDGMEKFANDQIATTTSLNILSVQTETVKRVDGITIKKDSFTFLQYPHFLKIRDIVQTDCYLHQRSANELSVVGESTKIGTHVTAVAGFKPDSVFAGRSFSVNDIDLKNSVCVVTDVLAKRIVKNLPYSVAIGKKLQLDTLVFEIIGVVKVNATSSPEFFYPITIRSAKDLFIDPPQLVVKAQRVEDVPKHKQAIVSYINSTFTSKNDFNIQTKEYRVEQAAKGFFLFRVIMGLIVGISVVVGGIGVMNVLLISVNERTTEIGIRKAMGATRHDIVLLFLAESITVSVFGSAIGVLFGVAFTMVAIPIVKAVTEIPFQAAYTFNTFLVISVISILVGVIFGTYPAMRASKLDPVEAMRHE